MTWWLLKDFRCIMFFISPLFLPPVHPLHLPLCFFFVCFLNMYSWSFKEVRTFVCTLTLITHLSPFTKICTVNCSAVTRMWKKHVLAQCISIFVTLTVNDTVYFLFLIFAWMQSLILIVHTQNRNANALCMCITGMQTFLNTEMQVDFLVKQLLRLSSLNKHMWLNKFP